ncbi:MAG TPA: ribosome recycling factor [bacterium]|jgi:ribosome recycling factor|nr:ribosome recycling factor [bacterium]
MSDAIYKQCEEKMGKAIDSTKRELAKLRLGKATPALLENIRVEAYGSQTPLNQVGSIGAPEPRLLVIQPWDKNLLAAIERAIRASDLGLNPSNDGQVIRVPIPALTEERRKELVKVAKHYAEEGRVAVRMGRRDANEALKKALKDGKITEDDERKALDKIQKLTDQKIKDLDEILASKETEILKT